MLDATALADIGFWILDLFLSMGKEIWKPCNLTAFAPAVIFEVFLTSFVIQVSYIAVCYNSCSNLLQFM